MAVPPQLIHKKSSYYIPLPPGSQQRNGAPQGNPPQEGTKTRYKNLTFQVKPMNFKHTGLFPEQAVNWDFAQERIRAAGRPVSVLNLFAYTGAASVACAAAGASVCHVDAAKGMVQWARENARASGLEEAPIRWIVDDCAKFVEREIRRGRRYDAVIMDPPSYGRGPTGEVWKLEDSLYPFVELCAQVLSDEPLFIIINSYTTGLAPSVLTYILETVVSRKFGGRTVSDEIGLPLSPAAARRARPGRGTGPLRRICRQNPATPGRSPPYSDRRSRQSCCRSPAFRP